MEEETGDFLGIKFCKNCDNMLYPQERHFDEGGSYLTFYCKICHHEEPADVGNEVQNCVYRNDLEQTRGRYLVDKELVCDPTLSRTLHAECPKCDHNEAVFF